MFFSSVLGLKKLCFSYAVVNPYGSNYYESLAWLRRCRGVAREVIVDTAVHKLFAELNLVDYPAWYLHRYLRFVRDVAHMVGRRATVWYVIPDIPVDYPGRESLYPYNVERTAQYIEMFLDRYVDALRPARPIAVVQGRKDDIRSVLDTYAKYEHLYSQFEVVGLGPVCQTRRWRLLAKLIVAFDRAVARPFHSFGVHISAVEKALGWGPRAWRSFDTTAYHWSGKRRVANPREREEAFVRYIEKLRGIGVETPAYTRAGG